MNRSIFKTTVLVLAGVLMLAGLVIFPSTPVGAEVKKIVRDTAVSDVYLPGTGTPIGKVSSVSGDVLIMHADMGTVFYARKDYPVYTGDTLTSKDKGKIAIVLKDDSVLTLAPGTTLVLNEAVFDPQEKKRSAMISLITGKARFLVKKFADFQNSTFAVKTKTSVAAVRGSDFIIEQRGDQTIITTMGMTVLSVTNTSNPLAEPITVTSMQQLILTLAQLEGSPFNVTEEQLIQILEGLGIPTDEGGDEGGEGEGGEGDEGDEGEEGDEGDAGDFGIGTGGSGSFSDQPISPYSPATE
ncbi:MAG: FecR family protein [Thermodesulfobacteriota bacterium]